MNKNLLVIGFVWPEPNSTAAGKRILQLLDLFDAYNYTITFVSAALKTKNSYDFEKTNVRTIEIQLNDSNFDVLVKKINPAVVLFDRFLTEEQFGWRVVENCPNALRILDTEDLHFLRNARQTAYKNKTAVTLGLLSNDLAKREIASIYRCDLSLIISKFEEKLLLNSFNVPKSLIIYVPFLLNSLELSTLNSYPSFSERIHFMTIGNFIHEPNWNSVLYLKNHIWPLINKKLPQAQMHIYGAYVTEKVRQLDNKKERFLIKGWTPDINKVFINSRVCLAPLQFGAGIKGKLIDAMQFGTPSVTTTIGSEAMHDELPWNGFIIDTAKEFAIKSIELYTNEKYWNKAQQNGIDIINACYSKETFGTKLLELIENLQASIEEHRLNNFTGGMLMQHKLKSTKYMSKWIEEKKKKEKK